MKISFAILAGGMSRRFGSDKTKALLGGIPLVARCVATAKAVSDDVFIVAKDAGKYADAGVPVYSDIVPEQCALSGLLTACHYAKQSAVLVLSADAPLFSPRHVQVLTDALGGYDAVVPKVHGKEYPASALYRTSAGSVVASQIASGNLRMMGLLAMLHVCCPDESSFLPFDEHLGGFLNINTPEDLVTAGRLIEKPE